MITAMTPSNCTCTLPQNLFCLPFLPVRIVIYDSDFWPLNFPATWKVASLALRIEASSRKSSHTSRDSVAIFLLSEPWSWSTVRFLQNYVIVQLK